MIATEVFKGQVTRRISVSSPPPNEACGLDMLERDVAYLIFATKSDIGKVATNICRINKPLELATTELEALGDGYAPEDAGGCSSLWVPRTEWLLVLALGGLTVLRRARRAVGAT